MLIWKIPNYRYDSIYTHTHTIFYLGVCYVCWNFEIRLRIFSWSNIEFDQHLLTKRIFCCYMQPNSYIYHSISIIFHDAWLFFPIYGRYLYIIWHPNKSSHWPASYVIWKMPNYKYDSIYTHYFYLSVCCVSWNFKIRLHILHGQHRVWSTSFNKKNRLLFHATKLVYNIPSSLFFSMWNYSFQFTFIIHIQFETPKQIFTLVRIHLPLRPLWRLHHIESWFTCHSTRPYVIWSSSILSLIT